MFWMFDKETADDPTRWVMDDYGVWRRVIYPGQVWAKVTGLSFYIREKTDEGWVICREGPLPPFFDRIQTVSEYYIWRHYSLYMESREEVRARGEDPGQREPLWWKRS